MEGEGGAGRDDFPLLDADHLTAQTSGDRELEREVLALFIDQLEAAAGRLPADAQRLHKLRGAALGVGAVAIARHCAFMERDPQDEASRARLVSLLARTLDVVRARAASPA